MREIQIELCRCGPQHASLGLAALTFVAIDVKARANLVHPEFPLEELVHFLEGSETHLPIHNVRLIRYDNNPKAGVPHHFDQSLNSRHELEVRDPCRSERTAITVDRQVDDSIPIEEDGSIHFEPESTLSHFV